MGKKLFVLFLSAILAIILIIGFLPATAMAAQDPVSATGTIINISGTDGYQAGGSNNFKVTSRTVTGTFDSGDLSGDYSFTYQGSFDLNTQAGNISGQLINGAYNFDVQGKSYPFTMIDNSTLFATAGGTFQGHGFSAGGTWTANYYFQIDDSGHIQSILPDSSFNITGKWNPN